MLICFTVASKLSGHLTANSLSIVQFIYFSTTGLIPELYPFLNAYMFSNIFELLSL